MLTHAGSWLLATGCQLLATRSELANKNLPEAVAGVVRRRYRRLYIGHKGPRNAKSLAAKIAKKGHASREYKSLSV